MTYDILILTDHSRHSEDNSVYELASQFAMHPEINSVDIASRGVSENAAFFNGQVDAVLSVIPGLPQLTLNDALHLFETALTETEIIDYDFILLRLPQPVPEALFRALPEVIPEDHIINPPSGIIRTGSKEFLTEVPDLCPPVSIVQSVAETMDFLTHHDLILKPFQSHGGKGIVKLTSDSAEDATGSCVTHDEFFRHWQPPYLAMQFLKNVTEGDKRTIVVNGQVIGSALRKPQPGSWMCNVAQGASFQHAIADRDEMHIAHRLAEEMRKYGIVIFGFDTLMNDQEHRVLSEINTMSVGGIKQTLDSHGRSVVGQVVSSLVEYMHHVWFGPEIQ